MTWKYCCVSFSKVLNPGGFKLIIWHLPLHMLLPHLCPCCEAVKRASCSALRGALFTSDLGSLGLLLVIGCVGMLIG